MRLKSILHALNVLWPLDVLLVRKFVCLVCSLYWFSFQFRFFFLCSRCACLMMPPSQGTKPYQARYLSVCSVLRAHISLAGLIRRMPPPTFSDTAVTDRHIDSDTTFPGLLDRKNRSDMFRRWESNPRLPSWTLNTLSAKPGAPLIVVPISC